LRDFTPPAIEEIEVGRGGADGEGATSHTCSRRSGLEGRLADKEKKRRGGGGQWARPDCDAEEVMAREGKQRMTHYNTSIIRLL
jgi:hypothetical protein